MTRGCVQCQGVPAKKAICCGQRLCEAHELDHDCPRARELDAIARDPAALRAWRAANAPEEKLTTAVLAALNALPGVTVWRAKRAQGARASSESDGVLDVIGFAAPDGIFLAVETKRAHKPECACRSCSDQRDFAARVNGAGGVAVLGARTVQQALDGVRLGLARARGRSAA